MAKQRRTDGRDNPKKKRTDGKPDDPMYPLLPNAPAGQRPKGGINEMFNPPAQNPPGQAPGVRKKGPLLKGLAFTPTPEPAPMLGLTDAARARQGAPLPEQRRVPASETQYLSMSPEQRTQENLRRRGMSPQEISQFNEGVANREPLQVPRNIPANMPSAPPQPQLPMSPAAGAPQPQQEMVGPQEIAGPPPTLPMSPVAPMQPPTNQYGQPVRGVLTPERAPEDPNRVMEQFGRGSPEHIQALQAQMRTQQVAVSRPEDMADPRLDRLPTGEQYEMDLTRRRYGEEAIDKRAGELRGEARFRTQADAVRLAGREALDQRRQDRGMLSFEDRDKKRQGIQDRQQQMFEERRGTRRDERQARRQEDIDRRTAAEMGIPYGEYLQQKEAMDLEKFRAKTERDAALGTIAAQRQATTTGAQTEVDVATLNAEAQKAIAGMSNEDRAAARTHLGQMKTEEFTLQRERLRQDGRLQTNAQLLSQAQTNAELQLRVMEMAPRFSPIEMVAIAEKYASNMGLDLDTVGIQVMNTYNNAQRVFGQQQGGGSEQGPPQIDVVQRPAPETVEATSPPPTTAETAPSTVEQTPSNISAPPATPRRSDRTEARPAPNEGAVQDESWMPLGDIQTGLFSGEADYLRQEEMFGNLSNTIFDLKSLHQSDPARAKERGKELIDKMQDAGFDSAFDFAPGSLGRNMYALKRQAFDFMLALAYGRDIIGPSLDFNAGRAALLNDESVPEFIKRSRERRGQR